MRFLLHFSGALALSMTLCGGAAAQEERQAPIPFAGGELTITQPEEYGEKTLSFDGKELASNYVVYFDRIATIGDVEVALFDVGDGGNACGPATVMVWKPEGGEIQSASIGEDDCGAPPAAVTGNEIYFVPWLLPGNSAAVKKWSPQDGFSLAGTLTYTPEPGTDWADIDGSRLESIIDAFHNEAVYHAAQKLLGDKLSDVTTALLVSSGTEKTASGVLYANGCVPHACGISDGFMAIDATAQKLYFARQSDEGDAAEGNVDAWPDLASWPAELRTIMDEALARQ